VHEQLLKYKATYGLLVVSKILATLPVVWVALLYVMYFFSAIKLGHWPIASLNDPKGFAFPVTVLRVAIWCVFYPMMFSFVLWPVSFLFIRRLRGYQKFYTRMFFIGCAFVLIQILLDPFSILSWFLD